MASPVGSGLRIAHVITRFIRGGADENTLITCNGQAREGHQVVLVHGDAHPEMLSRLDQGVKAINLSSLVRPVSPVADVKCLAALVRLFSSWRPDIVHTHESKAGVTGRIAAHLARAPLTVHGVHILAHLNAGSAAATVYRTAEQTVAPLTDLFINVSEGMRTACLNARIGDPDRHVVIESGMPIEDFKNGRPPAEAVRAVALAGIAPHPRPVYLLTTGALEPRKRIGALLDVFAAVAARRPEARLLVAGEGPLLPSLQGRAMEPDLQGRVAFLGHRADLADWIAFADICVHASAREGLPRVVVQYAACGKPIVATALVGIERLVKDGENGFLLPVEDLDAMADRLVVLVGDAARRQEFGARSRAIDVSAWSDAHMVRRIDKAYAMAAQRARRPLSEGLKQWLTAPSGPRGS